MQVIIVDDHTIVLDGLRLLLSTFPFITKVDTAMDNDELCQLLEKVHPDIILLDINLMREDGREICKNLKKKNPDYKIIALTTYSDKSTFKSSLIAGFDGYLLKSEGRNIMMEALQKVHQGEKYYSPKLSVFVHEQQASKRKIELSQREKEVLAMILEEKTTKEIADALFISPKTVEGHRYNLLLKFDVKNLAGLVKKAILLGYA